MHACFRLLDPVTVPCQYRVAIGVSQSNAYFVQPRRWILWFKAQQISAMQMVGKFGHQPLKTFLRSKKLIFASGHGCDAFGGIFTHGLPGHFHEAKYVEIPAGRVRTRVPLSRSEEH